MVTPIRDLVLAKPFPSDERSSGGIIVSEAHREMSNKMRVIAVGNGTAKEKMQFKKDDVVFRVQNHGDEIIIDGEKHFLIKQSHLIAQLS